MTLWYQEYSKFLKSEQWKLVRARILNYYGKKCKCCGTTAGQIQVHHLSYRNYKNPPLSDVTVLCRDCHEDVTQITRKKKLKGLYAVTFHKNNCRRRRR